MEELIAEAYRVAATKDFYAITRQVERLVKQHYSTGDPCRDVRTGEVRRVLEHRGLDFSTYRIGA